MLPLYALISSVLLISTSAAVIPSHSYAAQQVVLPPSQDPFYIAPNGFADKNPGTILRMRLAPGRFTAFNVNCNEVYNIMFRTTDSRYRASWAVTTLLIPRSPLYGNSTSKTKLLTYLIAYDSTDVNASPSFALYAPSTPNRVDVNAMLSRGWYINVPDYEGPLASYSAGVQSGHATLDSVRAARAAAMGLGLSPNARSAMWGYSGGALAGEWAAELQVQYAPELKFVGLAIGGITPNTTNVLLSVDGGFYAGLIPLGFAGLATQYPAVETFLRAHLKQTGPQNASIFNNVSNLTFDQAIEAFANQTITNYFTTGPAFISAPEILAVTNTEGQMGYHGVPQMPVFAYKAIKDEISPVNDTDNLVNRYCAVGAEIWYQRNTIGGHIAEETNGRAAALAFLDSVLGAMYHQTGCLIQTVSVNISDTSQ